MLDKHWKTLAKIGKCCRTIGKPKGKQETPEDKGKPQGNPKGRCKLLEIDERVKTIQKSNVSESNSFIIAE